MNIIGIYSINLVLIGFDLSSSIIKRSFGMFQFDKFGNCLIIS
jgi:hypothetical protein